MDALQVPVALSLCLLERVADLVTRALANAPFEDEPLGVEEECSAAESNAWLKHIQPIANEEVLAMFGLTQEDFERMGHTPLEIDAK